MNQKAFTLVELAIVIVIIGLLVGGVLQGKELIDQAKVRAQISQLRAFETAHLAFKAKYNCLAGDCTGATSFFTSGAVNGNGNGDLDNSAMTSGYDGSPYPTWSTSPEYGQFFLQLSKATLIKGTFDGTRNLNQGIPSLSGSSRSGMIASSSISFVTAAAGRTPTMSIYRTGKNALFLVACNINGDSMGTWDDVCGVFTPSMASQIDSKIDDGNPLSGIYFSFSGGAPTSTCLTSGSYNYTNEAVACQSIYVFDK